MDIISAYQKIRKLFKKELVLLSLFIVSGLLESFIVAELFSSANDPWEGALGSFLLHGIFIFIILIFALMTLGKLICNTYVINRLVKQIQMQYNTASSQDVDLVRSFVKESHLITVFNSVVFIPIILAALFFLTS